MHSHAARSESRSRSSLRSVSSLRPRIHDQDPRLSILRPICPFPKTASLLTAIIPPFPATPLSTLSFAINSNLVTSTYITLAPNNHRAWFHHPIAQSVADSQLFPGMLCLLSTDHKTLAPKWKESEVHTRRPALRWENTLFTCRLICCDVARLLPLGS
jgi:hypothetical protein